MARKDQDTDTGSSLDDYIGNFFGGASSGTDGARVSAPTTGRTVIDDGGDGVTPRPSIGWGTTPDDFPGGPPSVPTTPPNLVAHGDPRGNSTNASNPANQYTATPQSTPNTGGRSLDDSYILNYISQWAGMPGADPSLKANPQYWLGRIKQTGGLGSDNLDYWQKAGVGPTAFFNNPGRETASSGLQGGPSTGFADPAYQQLVSLAQQRIAQLGQPVSFPALDDYMTMLKQSQADSKARAATFADQLSGRVAQLQKPLLSDANTANIRAEASNNLLGQRDNQLAAVRADLARRGFDPNSSGLETNQENIVNQNYSNAQSNIDAKLQEQSISQDEQRRNQAAQLQGLILQALQGGDVASLNSAATMTDLENQIFNINNNRAREALTTAQIPVDLTNQGFANSLNASNSVSNPLGLLLSLASIGNQQQGIQQAGSNSNMAALAWLIQTALS
jgi:hypothetical protein